MIGQRTTFAEKPKYVTQGGVTDAIAEFTGLKRGLEAFYRTVAQGSLTVGLLQATQSRSFLEAALRNVGRQASFANMLSEILSNKHTSYISMRSSIGWLTIISEMFTQIPIPTNIDANKGAKESVDSLENLMKNGSALYDASHQAVKVLKPHDDKLVIAEQPGLEFSIQVNGQSIPARFLESNGETLCVDDLIFNNGLPQDRAKYPSIVLPSGNHISYRVKNTSTDKIYLVVPTINGIPIQTKYVKFALNGFSTNYLPISEIEPHMTYLKPGETREFSQFQVDETKIVKQYGGHGWELFGFCSSSDLEHRTMAFALGEIHDTMMSSEQREYLDSIMDPHLRAMMELESKLQFTKQFADYLRNATSTVMQLTRPTMAADASSSELNNPMLGSLGVAVFEVSAPPIKARHDFIIARQTMGTDTLMMSPTRGVGDAGLAGITGDYGRTAQKLDPFDHFQYDTMNHRFIGYFPVNVVSTTRDGLS